MAFEMTAQRMRAAAMCAEDLLSDQKISQEVGVNRYTLRDWRIAPEFKAEIAKIRAELCESIKDLAIVSMADRVTRLDTDRNALREIRKQRAESAMMRIEAGETVEPGEDTGLVIRTETPVRGGVKIEYAIDTALLGELRAIELQAAKELGQWQEKASVKTESTVTVGFDPLQMISEDELDRLAAKRDQEPPSS